MLHTNWYIDVMIRLPCHLQTACGYLHVRVARRSRLPGGLYAGERSTKECQWGHGNAAVEHCAARPLGAPWKHCWRPAEISRCIDVFTIIFQVWSSAEHDDLSNLANLDIHCCQIFFFGRPNRGLQKWMRCWTSWNSLRHQPSALWSH